MGQLNRIINKTYLNKINFLRAKNLSNDAIDFSHLLLLMILLTHVGDFLHYGLCFPQVESKTFISSISYM